MGLVATATGKVNMSKVFDGKIKGTHTYTHQLGPAVTSNTFEQLLFVRCLIKDFKRS